MDNYILLGILAGIIATTASEIYFRFRVTVPTGKSEKIREGLKWIAWIVGVFILPMLVLDNIKSGRGIAFWIYLTLFLSHYGFWIHKAWRKGKLKILGDDEKVIYEGRKSK
jgi:hypothetical protein